jgi:hypothetical protein
MSEQLEAIRGALNILGHNTTLEVKKSNVVPTAKTRTAIDFLASSNPQKIVDDRIDLRKLSDDLFNWAGEAKSTKTVTKALATALNTENKYSQAVELTAYISALAPLLQPDRLVRLFNVIEEVDTAYAPAKYTMQLSNKLERLLKRYPEERREKLAYSLWVQAHKGRWWDLTAGTTINPEVLGIAEGVEGEHVAGRRIHMEEHFDDVVEAFVQDRITWGPLIAEELSQIEENPKIIEALRVYNDKLLRGKLVDPDLGVLSSHIPWLTSTERPESPIGSLLDGLDEIVTLIEYDLPLKPKSFSELFPNINLYGTEFFPFPNDFHSKLWSR